MTRAAPMSSRRKPFALLRTCREPSSRHSREGPSLCSGYHGNPGPVSECANATDLKDLTGPLPPGLLKNLITNTCVHTVAVPLCAQLIAQQVDTAQNPQGHSPCEHLNGAFRTAPPQPGADISASRTDAGWIRWSGAQVIFC